MWPKNMWKSIFHLPRKDPEERGLLHTQCKLVDHCRTRLTKKKDKQTGRLTDLD